MQALDPVRMLGVPEFGRIAGGQAHGEEICAGSAVRQQPPALGQEGLQHVGFSWRPPPRLPLYLAPRRPGARLGRRGTSRRVSARAMIALPPFYRRASYFSKAYDPV